MPFLPSDPSGEIPILDKRQTFESEGMRLPAFGWMLVLGAFASLGAVALDNAPSLGGAAHGSVPTTSAGEALFAVPGNPIAESVTQPQPDSGPGSDPGSDPGSGAISTGPTDAADITPESATAGALERAEAGAVSTPSVPNDAPRPLPNGVSAPVSIEPVAEKEFEIIDAMNGARLELGLQPLVRYAELDEVALARARHLVGNGYFDHYAPDGTSAFSELAVRRLLYRLAGENLARNNYPPNQTVAAAFEGLMASPGHRANILEPMFGAVGVAVVRDGNVWVYVTVFTNPR